MNSKLIALSIAGALALGTLSASAEDEGKRGGHGERGWHGGHDGGGMHGGMLLEHLTKNLDLTPQQQQQVAPIIEQARPQMQAIHKEAMEKAKTVMENAASQVRAVLTPQQQAKFDAMRKAHEDMRNARREMQEAKRK